MMMMVMMMVMVMTMVVLMTLMVMTYTSRVVKISLECIKMHKNAVVSERIVIFNYQSNDGDRPPPGGSSWQLSN